MAGGDDEEPVLVTLRTHLCQNAHQQLVDVVVKPGAHLDEFTLVGGGQRAALWRGRDKGQVLSQPTLGSLLACVSVSSAYPTMHGI